jgi:hypothetical protein
MMLEITIMLLMIAATGALKGIADKIQHSPTYRTDGWKNKWKQTSTGHVRHFGDLNHWWYLYGALYQTKDNQRERFIFSSTLLVAFTDKWHMANFCTYRLMDTTIAYYTHTWWLLAALPLARYIGFKFFYKKKA